MKHRAGFTLIELLITITIMVILLTLTVVNLRGNQAAARDEERKNDVTAIAQQLESFFQTGSDAATTTGEYPAVDAMSSEAVVKTTLRDIDVQDLRDPSTTTDLPISLIVATSASIPTLASLNSGETYIYQPLDGSNALCATGAQECRKFNLYYTLETDPTVKTIASRHQ